AASPGIVSGCVPFRHGHWLLRQLGQKPVFSLCYHWPTISDWRRPVSALRRAHDPRRHALGLASPSHRRRHRVSVGMALWEASCVLSVEKSHVRCLLVFPREEQVGPTETESILVLTALEYARTLTS